MNGLAAITARMAQIDAQIAGLSAVSRAAVPTAVGSGQAAVGGGQVATPSFASALTDAVAATSGTGAPAGITSPNSTASMASPAGIGAGASGRLTAEGVPVELAAYGNGRVPASALAPVDGNGGHRLWAPAAAAFQRLQSAASRAGVSIGVTDSYRSFDAQVDVARRKGLHSQGGLAAKPGTSEHGWGKSLDLHLDPRAQTWMRSNAGEYGFTENVSREPWHWTFSPA